MCTQGIHLSMKIPKTARQTCIYMSFWTKEKVGGRFWSSKGQIGNSQGAEKVANKFLLGNPETTGQGTLANRLQPGSFLFNAKVNILQVIMIGFPS